MEERAGFLGSYNTKSAKKGAEVFPSLIYYQAKEHARGFKEVKKEETEPKGRVLPHVYRVAGRFEPISQVQLYPRGEHQEKGRVEL